MTFTFRLCLIWKSCILYLLLSRPAAARTWLDVELIQLLPQDFRIPAQAYEVNPLTRGAPSPTASPTIAPITTLVPQSNSDRIPFDGELAPTDDGAPSSSPTLPLSDKQNFTENPVPLNPPQGYFNYDLRDSSIYGPGYPAMVREDSGFVIQYQNNGWATVQNPADFYWKEFTIEGFGTWKGALASRDFDTNQCGKVGMQSPIDIRLSGVACVEHHQIRSRRGDFKVDGSSVQRRIESNKLRLVWQRRPCANLLDSQCDDPNPPGADFPNGWGGIADSLHVDFKIPAEHRIYGESFDAEMQIYHLHAERQRIPAISVLIRAQAGGHNDYLQKAINAFQYEYDLHRAECANKMQSSRQLVNEFHKRVVGEQAAQKFIDDYDETWGDYSTLMDDPEFIQRGQEYDRFLTSGSWDPYDFSLIPTYWFYGYDGSLTEPPCTEIVSWFVMDTPMIISLTQLEQLKRILFGHVDSNCQATSVQFNGSVARPIQESAGRQVWQCTRDNYLPDSASTTSAPT